MGSSRGFVERATAAAPLRAGAGGRRGWAAAAAAAVAAAGGCWKEGVSHQEQQKLQDGAGGAWDGLQQNDGEKAPAAAYDVIRVIVRLRAAAAAGCGGGCSCGGGNWLLVYAESSFLHWVRGCFCGFVL